MTFDPLSGRGLFDDAALDEAETRLPGGFIRHGVGFRCLYCNRAWKFPKDLVLGQANVDYLTQHVETHVRQAAQRPIQRWSD